MPEFFCFDPKAPKSPMWVIFTDFGAQCRYSSYTTWNPRVNPKKMMPSAEFSKSDTCSALPSRCLISVRFAKNEHHI